MSQLETALKQLIREVLNEDRGSAAIGEAPPVKAAGKPTRASTAKTAEAAPAAAPVKSTVDKKTLADAVVALAKIPEGGRDSAVGILKKHGVEKVSDLAEAQYAAVHKDVIASTKSFSAPAEAEPASLV